MNIKCYTQGVKINSELETILENEMNESHKKLIANAKYWYPLAVPSYGVEEVVEALNSMTSFKTSMWEKTKLFEELFGQKFGGYAIMVNSGSSADLLISYALQEASGGPLRPGAEILVPAVTWPTHVWSPLMAGFNVTLIDVDPRTFNVNLEDLKSKVNKNTGAFFGVHLMGNVANHSQISEICSENDLIYLEDSCEALGSKWAGSYVGTLGLAGSFSFFFSHHLMTMEGGMILTKDKDFADRCRLLRAHGWARHLESKNVQHLGLDSRYTFLDWGFNLRPTEVQASFGIQQLRRFDEFDSARKANAALLLRVFEKYPNLFQTMSVSIEVTCSWFAFPVLVIQNSLFNREDFCNYLEISGIETRPVVAGNLARQPAMSRRENIKFGHLPGADIIHEQGFYIGIAPFNSSDSISKLEVLLDEFINTKQ